MDALEISLVATRRLFLTVADKVVEPRLIVPRQGVCALQVRVVVAFIGLLVRGDVKAASGFFEGLAAQFPRKNGEGVVLVKVHVVPSVPEPQQFGDSGYHTPPHP